MKTYRSDAALTGIFFIIATTFLFLGEAFYKPILTAPDYLSTLAANKPVVVFGILIEFLCVLAIPLIAVFIYPVFRLLEAAILISVAEVNKLSLIGLSEAYLASGETDANAFENIGRAIQAQTYWGNTAGLLYNLIFVFGALILYASLYRTRLIPRILSGWGLVSALMLGSVALAAVFVEVSPALAVLLVGPLALQEMVMALWFIVKGFDPAALARLQENQAAPAPRILG